MRILGQLVMRNEVDRYLDAVLSWDKLVLDAIHCFDDHSTDESVELAMAHGAVVTRRPNAVPCFLADEARFREAAWRAMEEALKPEPGDWVLSIDADELVMSNGGGTELDALYQLALNAKEEGIDGYHIAIPEVFEVTELEDGGLANPHIRYDGFWNRIAGLRYMRWEPGGKWGDKAFGCGSAPTYVEKTAPTTDVVILHYGYADPADRAAKFERYSSMDHKHNDAHIMSIPEPPLLQRWDGPYINLWRGKRSRVALDD